MGRKEKNVFGWGRFGSNVRHFRPSPEHIEDACREIQERGFTDSSGVWHSPWSDVEYMYRRGGFLSRDEKHTRDLD
jgi:hypothetical protein